MVAYTTDFYGYTIHVADDTADVGEHLPEVFVAYLHAMIFDVEDDMDVVFASELPMVVEFLLAGGLKSP